MQKKKWHQPATRRQNQPGGSIVPWIAVGVLSAGLGSALPFLLAGQQTHAAGGSGENESEGSTTDSGSHGSTAKSDLKKVKSFTMPKEEDTIFLPFGEPGKDQSVVVNLDDIRGAAGQNRLRREIREQFNAVLCPDGYDQIYDVLFEEFNVQ